MGNKKEGNKGKQKTIINNIFFDFFSNNLFVFSFFNNKIEDKFIRNDLFSRSQTDRQEQSTSKMIMNEIMHSTTDRYRVNSVCIVLNFSCFSL